MARGMADGWYAYWFLNPTDQPPGELLASILVLLLGFGLAAAALVLIDRLLGNAGRISTT